MGKKLDTLTQNTSPASTDIILMTDDPAGIPLSQKIEVGDLLSAPFMITGLTADATPDDANDYGITYDDSAGVLKKVLLSNWPGGASAINDLTDVTITGTPADNEVVAYNTGTGEFINQTAAEAGLAAASHTHTASDIDSGAATDGYVLTADGAGNAAWEAAAAGTSDHGTLTGLGDDDHTQYLLASGLREWDQQGADPSTPAATKWKLYFKAGGLYLIDATGTVTGPLGTGGSSTGEINVEAAGMWPSSTSGAEMTKTEHTTNDVDVYSLDFDASTDEYAQFSIWMPDNWDGSTITYKVCWTADGGSIADDVYWGLQGHAYADGDALDDTWGTAVLVNDALLTVDDVHYTSESSAVTLGGNPAAGERVQFRIYRDADNASDTLANDAQLLGVKIYYGIA